mgnify:CR=1 FL=1
MPYRHAAAVQLQHGHLVMSPGRHLHLFHCVYQQVCCINSAELALDESLQCLL